MTKARLIKPHEAQEASNRRAKKNTALQSATTRRPVDAIREWVEQHRAARPDPRQAFAALFAQPQN